MGKKERARGHVIKRMEGIHQGNPLQFYSIGLVREYMVVEPVQEKIHVLKISIGRRGSRAKALLSKSDKAVKEVTYFLKVEELYSN
ncbi:hypothetical protein COP2_009784 [Malus domestica]